MKIISTQPAGDVDDFTDKEGKTTNHPRLDANLPQFELDLKLAQQMAENRPPNYYLAGRITGTCSYCHSKQK